MQPIVPFEEFKNSLSKKSITKRLHKAEGLIATRDELERMRNFLLKYYQRTSAIHSFMDGSQIFDCIPVEKQPGLDVNVELIDEAPPFPGPELSGNFVSQEVPGQKDIFGNDMSCPPGYVPIRRMTLEELATEKNVDLFHRKQSFLMGDTSSLRRDLRNHVFGRQFIGNEGAGCVFNVWQPRVASTEYFSLSQMWVQGGIDGDRNKQTIEVGWHVSPRLWKNHGEPVLFIYWSTHNYKYGGFNKERGMFVQKNNAIRLGGTLPVSTIDGPQVEFQANWLLRNGKWWLYFNRDPVGFFPAEMFRGGLLSNQSELVIFGGEVNGKGSCPEMGSGQPAMQGNRRAAYIRNMTFAGFDQADYPAELQFENSAPDCFDYREILEHGWGSAFYFGGSGGSNC